MQTTFALDVGFDAGERGTQLAAARGNHYHRHVAGHAVTSYHVTWKDINVVSEKMRLEGITLTVQSVERSIAFYSGKLGLEVEWNALPAFAMIRVGGDQGATIGLLASAVGAKEGVEDSTSTQKRAVHVEFSTDDLDGLYENLKAKGVIFHQPPHDEPWERSMTAFDPDGYAVEFAQGGRGRNSTKP